MSLYHKIFKTLIILFFIFSIFNLFFAYKKYKNDIYFKKINNFRFSEAQKDSESDFEYFKFDKCKPDNIFPCFKKQIVSFKPIDSNEKILKAYSEMNQLIIENKINSSLCHILSHDIGKKIYRDNADLQNILTIDIYAVMKDTNCGNGYYHGIMLGISESVRNENELISNIKKIISKNDSLIQSISIEKKNKFIYYDFYHGLGHVAFHYANTETNALKICKEILPNETYKQNLCFTGVFMEEGMNMQAMGINLDISICKNVDDEYKNACYTGIRMDNEYLEAKNKYYSDVCMSEINPDFKLSCIRGYATQTSMNFAKTDKAIEFCNNIKEEKLKMSCFITYIQFINNGSKIDFRDKLIERICLTQGVYEYLYCKNTLLYSKINIPSYDRGSIDNIDFAKFDLKSLKILFN